MAFSRWILHFNYHFRLDPSSTLARLLPFFNRSLLYHLFVNRPIVLLGKSWTMSLSNIDYPFYGRLMNFLFDLLVYTLFCLVCGFPDARRSYLLRKKRVKLIRLAIFTTLYTLREDPFVLCVGILFSVYENRFQTPFFVNFIACRSYLAVQTWFFMEEFNFSLQDFFLCRKIWFLDFVCALEPFSNRICDFFRLTKKPGGMCIGGTTTSTTITSSLLCPSFVSTYAPVICRNSSFVRNSLLTFSRQQNRKRKRFTCQFASFWALWLCMCVCPH